MDAKFYVPYETARELRLKGYPQSTDTWYVETAKGVRTYKKQSAEYEYIARPTYHEVLDWLTKRYIDIDTEYSSCTGMWSCRTQKWGTFFTEEYHTREDALNAAILETLKRI